MIRIGGAEAVQSPSYSCAVAVRVGAGGGSCRVSEAQSENVQDSAWLRIYLPAITVQTNSMQLQ